MTSPFGRDLTQTDDWRTWGIGMVAGGIFGGGLWLASSRGVELDWALVTFCGICSSLLGVLILAWKKGRWSARRRWCTEALGFALMGPLLAVSWGFLIYPITAGDFAPPAGSRD